MCRISGEDIVDNGGVKLKFTRKNLCIPYVVYLVLFVALPLIVLFYYAFTDGTGQFTVQNLTGFFTDPNAIGTLLYSFAVAIVTTAVCLLLAYPIAYILAMSSLKRKSTVIMIFVIADVDQLFPPHHRAQGSFDGAGGKSCDVPVPERGHRHDV